MIADDPSIIKPIFESLKKTFRSGKTLPLEYRKQQLRSLVRGMKELELKFNQALEKDLGFNPFMSKMYSTSTTIREIEDTLHNIDKWVCPEKTDVPIHVGPGKSYIMSEPLGVALMIGAWNYPVPTCVPYVATAISAGNCCILKPSEISANTSKVIAELFEKYLDKECFGCIEGQTEVAKAIIKEPFDVIVFTGSTEKGKLVAKAAAENLTPCILELGGKSPTIVDKEADLDNAALRITQARYSNCGQTCIACDYVLVHKDIKAKLIEKFKEKLIRFYSLDPSKSNDYSRIINGFHFKRVKSYLDEGHGGKLIVGGETNAKTKYIAPTIIENPKLTSKLMQDEIFGPILPICEFDDFDFVLNFIKDRPKPLAIYYYGSSSSQNYKRLKIETSSGALSCNESCLHGAILENPFGGVGLSGIGKLHGIHGFKSLSHQKSVLEKGTFNSFPLNARYPPYTPGKVKMLNFMLPYTGITQGFVIKIILLWILLLLLAIFFKRGLLSEIIAIVGNYLLKVTPAETEKDL